MKQKYSPQQTTDVKSPTILHSVTHSDPTILQPGIIGEEELVRRFKDNFEGVAE